MNMEDYRLSLEEMMREDVGSGDVTSNAIVRDECGKAVITAKMPCVVAGLAEAVKVFALGGAEATEMVRDGASVNNNNVVLDITGPVKAILMGERLALNLMGRMSGIATLTADIVAKAKAVNPEVDIYATRKTTPGFRWYEKRAVVIGGGKPHRFGLYDAVLIKENHINFAGGIECAVKKVRDSGFEGLVEIEVETLAEAGLAASLGVDVIMLDNMAPKLAEAAYSDIKQINPDIKVEISGGMNPNNVEDYAKHADIISLGCLTHSAKSIDFSLELL
jgi:nicotinate-nucleotide pyrophosphorylase (carboxylating)